MHHQPFALHSNRVVTPGGVRPAAVLISEGQIAGVVSKDQTPLSYRMEDVGNLVVMPGLVDSHVHINEPRTGTEWEGFETATKSAAAGGITTLVDMPLNSLPVTTTPDAFKKKLEASGGKRYVDCGFYGGLIPGNANQLPALIQAGVLGVKAFLVHSGIDEFPNATEVDLRAAMPILAERDIPLLVHAELASHNLQSEIRNPKSYLSYLSSRPRQWEQKAIELMIRLCREYECRTHIVHLSSADAVPVLRHARAEGLLITVETCPHYLYFTAEEIADGDTRFKCAPPIREQENRERLWQALGEGVINFIVSDHSPCPPEMKLVHEGDFQKAWGGIASLQLGLPIVWTEARHRGFTIEHIVRWMSQRPAQLVGLEDRKGAIAPGYDADFVVWDPEEKFTVAPEKLHHRHPMTPYEGKSLYGKVERTYLRGNAIYEGGKFAEPTGTLLLRHADSISANGRS